MIIKNYRINKLYNNNNIYNDRANLALSIDHSCMGLVQT